MKKIYNDIQSLDLVFTHEDGKIESVRIYPNVGVTHLEFNKIPTFISVVTTENSDYKLLREKYEFIVHYGDGINL